MDIVFGREGKKNQIKRKIATAARKRKLKRRKRLKSGKKGRKSDQAKVSLEEVKPFFMTFPMSRS